MPAIHSLSGLLEIIGVKLYKARHDRNEKITTAAQAIGISHSVLSQVEHGKYLPLTIGLLLRIAGHYNIDLLRLLQPDTQYEQTDIALQMDKLIELIRRMNDGNSH